MIMLKLYCIAVIFCTDVPESKNIQQFPATAVLNSSLLMTGLTPGVILGKLAGSTKTMCIARV